jgi:ribosomal protein S11
MAGVPVYLFNVEGAYLGVHRITDAAGVAEFSAAAGRFKLRADYLGYQFWSDEVVVAADTAVSLMIPHQDVAIGVSAAFADTISPLPEIPVHLFTPSGAFLNRTLRTDPDGEVLIHLPERAYRVRADRLDQQFWSEAFTWQDSLVTIPMADAEITVTWSGFPVDGVPVYAFSETGRYLNLSGTSDAAGQAVFRLAAGTYQFRADYQGSQYWSAATVMAAAQITPVPISTGGGTFSLTVAKAPGEPLAGASCYVFSAEGAYLNLSGVTDSRGAVAFDLADGAYRLRIDYLGYPFWTEPLRVPETLEHAAVIAHHDLKIRVEGAFAGDFLPRPNIPVHFFDAAGAYLSVSERTDENGEVFFSLPQKPYQVRVDTLGQQFWSEAFNDQDVTVTIPEAVARVRVAGAQQALGGVPVTVFSAADSYLDLRQTTDPDGIATFRLPAGNYKFRADYQGNRYWAAAGLSVDTLHDVALETGGGAFALSVDTGSGPLKDARVYVFSAAGAYLGLYGVTDANGQAVFGLADGSYTFRVDHLGYQFWSPVYSVPDHLSGVFAIPHREVTIAVAGDFPAAEPLAGLKVHLFTPAGAYLSRSWTTDQNGQVRFNLPDRAYKVRVDCLGQWFWSDEFRSQNATVTIRQGAVGVGVTHQGTAVAGAKVHLFSETGAYLGICLETDAFGAAHFVLPEGTFKFRIDQNGEKDWTQPFSVQPGGEMLVPVELGE